MEIKDQIPLLESRLGLKRYQLAEKLGVTPEWLSRVVRKGAKTSDDLSLRIDRFLTDQDIDPRSFFTSSGSIKLTASIRRAQGIDIDADSGGTSAASSLLRDIERHHASLLEIAGGDPARLGWIREQQRAHLAPPAHWHGKKLNPFVGIPTTEAQRNPPQPARGGSSSSSAERAS